MIYRQKATAAEQGAANRSLIAVMRDRGDDIRPVATGAGRFAQNPVAAAWADATAALDYRNRRGARARSLLKHHALIDLRLEAGALIARVNDTELLPLRIACRPPKPALREELRAAVAEYDRLAASPAYANAAATDHLTADAPEAVLGWLADRDLLRACGLLPVLGAVQPDCPCADATTFCAHALCVLLGVACHLNADPLACLTPWGLGPAALEPDHEAPPEPVHHQTPHELAHADLHAMFGQGIALEL